MIHSNGLRPVRLAHILPRVLGPWTVPGRMKIITEKEKSKITHRGTGEGKGEIIKGRKRNPKAISGVGHGRGRSLYKAQASV